MHNSRIKIRIPTHLMTKKKKKNTSYSFIKYHVKF